MNFNHSGSGIIDFNKGDALVFGGCVGQHSVPFLNKLAILTTLVSKVFPFQYYCYCRLVSPCINPV